MIIDIIFILLMILAIFRGLSKGLILGLFSLVAFIIGIAAAMKLSLVLAEKMQGGSPNKWVPVISFILVFIVVVLLVRLGAKLIEKTVQLAMLGWLNRLGGVVLYVILYGTIFSVFLFYATKIGIFSPATVTDSNIYPYVAEWAPSIIDGLGKVIPFFSDMFTGLQDFFGGIATKAA